MAISRGQMNRQLYAEGGIKSLMDIIASNPDKFADILNILEDVPSEVMGGPYMGRPTPRTENDFMRRYRQGRPEMEPETDEEVMERLMELQRRPEYQYDEENMYEGPRDMRMSGGIMNVPIVNNRIHAFGGFGGIVKSIGKAVGSVAKGVGSAVKSASKLIDPVAQVASFVPGPLQVPASIYTTGRGLGIGGGGYGGLKVGPFAPSGGFFNMVGLPQVGNIGGAAFTSTAVPSSVAGMEMVIPGASIPTMSVPSSVAGMEMVIPGASIPSTTTAASQRGIGSFFKSAGKSVSSVLDKIQSTIKDKPLTSLYALGQLGASAYGAKLAKEDQERINKLRQQAYDEYVAKRERKRTQYETGEGLPELPVVNRNRKKEDVIGRPGAMQGGLMDLNIRTNPQGVKELDYRQEGGFVPPIGIKEKADDIPAMLSNNEFVFTADAVRGAGNGNVNQGAKRMYTLMKKLEAGGKA
jgi:hypothetical protein